MTSNLDSLSRRDERLTPHRRSPAWLLPLAIGVGFFILFFALFRDRLLPAPSVEVAVVLSTPITAASTTTTTPAPEAKPGSGRALFQASGWVEPDPLPYRASALIDGVIDTVCITEGQKVEKGELLATLVDSDSRLALKAAEQEHKRLQSAHAAHLGVIATVRRKLISAKSAIDAAQATEDEAEDQSQRANLLKDGAMSRGEITSAKLALVRAKAQKAMAESTADEITADISRLELEASVKADEIAAAAIGIEKAKLTVERTRIVSPIGGRVLRLLAAPGQKRMLSMDDDNSSTIAILYDPEKLQVRVDVPLADAAGLQIGQKARIHCGLLPDREFHGEVTRILGEADLQRNTLQAKVRILDPIDSLRPEMLCRAEFLATPEKDSPSLSSPTASSAALLAAWVPERAILEGTVWVCDPQTKRVTPKPVEPSASRDGYRQINDVLRPGEWVVLAPKGLHDGQRVNSNLVDP